MKSNADIRYFHRQAVILKALAQEARLQMVHNLGRGDRTVGELTDLVGLDPSTVSRHLNLLKNAGIVTSRREGKSVVYHLAMPCALGFFSCANEVLQQLEQPLAESARRQEGRYGQS